MSIRTFCFAALGVALTGVTTSAMAVLPTVALDPAQQDAPSATRLILAPAAPIVISSGNPPAMQSTAATTQLQQRLLASVVGRDAAGNEVLSPITAQTRIAAGNVIEYHGYVINRSANRVRSVKATFALPANTELTSLADLSPSRAYGSVDGVNFQYMPLKANIGGVVQDVPMSSYKAVQWDVQGLGLNEVAEVKFRVRVK